MYTQTTDVEGEVNGLVTYDRRIQRADEKQWVEDISALYKAAESRGGYAPMFETKLQAEAMRLGLRQEN